MTGPRVRASLQDWLNDLIAAPFDEQRTLAIDGVRAGLAFEHAYCMRHELSLTWTSAYRHLSQTENDWRKRHNDPLARLHEHGDLRPGTPTDLPPRAPWTVSRCRARSCKAEVIWAVTARGKRMPVDVAPSPAGTVLLSVQPLDMNGDPLATVVHTEAERDQVAGKLRTSHFATCANAGDWRRQPTTAHRRRDR